MKKRNNTFYAMLSRMKYIERWALMRNSERENISEHSLEVAMIAHALAIIGNVRLGRDYNAEHIAMLGIYHDCTEIITGDMPTPVKYYNDEMRKLYQTLEEKAAAQLAGHLPQELQQDYLPLLSPQKEDADLLPYLKAADKLSALIKCMQEQHSGNQEFSGALFAQQDSLRKMKLPEADYFLEHFIPPFVKSLDEQQDALNILK